MFPLKNISIEAIRKTNFKKLSSLQLKTFQIALRGCDLLVQMELGADRTMTVGLLALRYVDIENDKEPDLDEINDTLSSTQKAIKWRRINTQYFYPQVLVVEPSRKSVENVLYYLRVIAAPEIRFGTFMGKSSSIRDDINVLKNGFHIIIGTPGRLCHLVDLKTLDVSRIRLVIIDDAEKMIGFRFNREIGFLLSKFEHQKQIILFSFLFPKHLEPVINRYMKDIQKICLDDEPATKTNTDLAHDPVITGKGKKGEDEADCWQSQFGHRKSVEMKNKKDQACQTVDVKSSDKTTRDRAIQTDFKFTYYDDDNDYDDSYFTAAMMRMLREERKRRWMHLQNGSDF